MSIDEIRRKAKESVSLVDDEVFEQSVQPRKSPTPPPHTLTPTPVSPPPSHQQPISGSDPKDELLDGLEIDNQLAQLNLSELNSLDDDIGENAKMSNLSQMPHIEQNKPKSLFDKGLDSARKR